jgi:hypothetical protein
MDFFKAMTRSRWRLLFAAALIALSAVIYLFEWGEFHDGRDTLFYLVQDIAFLPISVLVVTVIIAEVLAWREREGRLHRLNMIIGVFFSEVGNDLLRGLMAFDPAAGELCGPLDMNEEWSRTEFAAARRLVEQRPCRCDARRGDLLAVTAILEEKRRFILSLVSNQSLLEHERFSELLWAVLHVQEEVAARGGLGVEDPPQEDVDHLSGDVGRAYVKLLREWIDYMEHLSRDYPYLYSLAARTNPVQQECVLAGFVTEPAAALAAAMPDEPS